MRLSYTHTHTHTHAHTDTHTYTHTHARTYTHTHTHTHTRTHTHTHTLLYSRCGGRGRGRHGDARVDVGDELVEQVDGAVAVVGGHTGTHRPLRPRVNGWNQAVALTTVGTGTDDAHIAGDQHPARGVQRYNHCSCRVQNYCGLLTVL